MVRALIVLMVVLGVALAFAALILGDRPSPVVSERIGTCERMIRDAAQWGVVEIDRPDQVVGQSTFQWERGSIVLTNGFGARVDASASCLFPDGEPVKLFLSTANSMTRCERDSVTVCQ